MSRTRQDHIVVGLSGGVDSTVAAWLLQRHGYRVTAVFMKNWEEDDDADYCAAAQDYEAATRVCEQLHIRLQPINFAAEYWDYVFSEFLSESAAGRTPNPDVLCNREIKFKAFLDYALALGADSVATGHYARIDHRGDRYQLLKGRDTNKDQSYFLYTLSQEVLEHVRFPLDELTKPQVRALAREAGLPNHARKDSTGICFIGERPFKSFVRRFLPPQPGRIRTLEGELKGEHDGLMYYTLGQRHGLGIGGPGGPWYVVDKDMAHNLLYVAEGHDHPALYSHWLQAGKLHWVAGSPPPLPLECCAKIRYRALDEQCRIEPASASTVSVAFARPQRAITPGQAVVFYVGDVCLGGGTIVGRPLLSARAEADGAIRVAAGR
ncbi:MAG: tRNA 2-thiouridine(34) synthase MnmA [Acidiferrobacterales bacterium]